MNIRDEILNELGVQPTESFNPEEQATLRVAFLKDYLKTSNLRAFCLGISGGVDSSTAGKIAQVAVNELNAEGYPCEFIAVRLPYGEQLDEDDAQSALDFIKPSRVITMNIKASTDATVDEGRALTEQLNLTSYKLDFAKGNIKARQRMVSQYYLSNLIDGLVIGTDHSAEAVTGFYTIHGDGACDVMPLSGLNKRQVRLLAKFLGAPTKLYQKTATADLEDLNQQLTDEDALGVTYEQIDDYLEGKDVCAKASAIIEKRFDTTRFKRRMPLSFTQI